MTPLHLAAYKGHFEIVKLLYEQHGADIMCIDRVRFITYLDFFNFYNIGW